MPTPIVKGGPSCSETVILDITLQEQHINYKIPAGYQGQLESIRQNFNYKNSSSDFEGLPDGRSSLYLDGFGWEYFRRGILKHFFPEKAGSLGVSIYLTKIDENVSDNSQLTPYLWEFIDTFLEGPEGINTELKEGNYGNIESSLAHPPKSIETLRKPVAWQHFSIKGFPKNRATDYYFTLLAPGYALNLQMVSSASKDSLKEYEYITETNKSAIDMIIDNFKIS